MAKITGKLRPINEAKSVFVDWLKNNNATEIEVDKPIQDNTWEYYCNVSAFVGDCLLTARFMRWKGADSFDIYGDIETRESGDLRTLKALLESLRLQIDC